jgi:hypothetical protein
VYFTGTYIEGHAFEYQAAAGAHPKIANAQDHLIGSRHSFDSA